MAEQPRCDTCGVFQQRTIEADGSDGWLCVHCSTSPIVDAVVDTRDELGLDKRVDAEARTCAFAFGLAEALTDMELTFGRGPAPIAAACIYLGSILAGDKLTQDDVAVAAGIGASTLRGSGQAIHYRELYEASGYADHFGDLDDRADQANPGVDLDGWRDHLEARLSQTTVKSNVSDVRRFAVWYAGDGAPDADDARAWFGYLADEEYAPSTIESRYESLKQYFEWAGLGDLDVDVGEFVHRAWQHRM